MMQELGIIHLEVIVTTMIGGRTCNNDYIAPSEKRSNLARAGERYIDRRVTGWGGVVFLLLNQIITLAPTKVVAEQQSASVAVRRPACPSKDFPRFFDTFAESAEIQKAFTQLPLTHGLLDLLADPPKFSRRKIVSFETIPSYNPEDSGAIFPTQAVRVKFRSFISMEIEVSGHLVATWRRYTPGDIYVGAGVNSVSVVLGVEDTGVSVRYRFHRLKNCWYLYAIDDNST
jgi:hypothetical protein